MTFSINNENKTLANSTDSQPQAQRRKERVALLSVASNSTLVLLKLIVGIVTGSVSVISEAIHSGNDLLAALIAFYSVKTSSRPADEKHPFGHGKIENISGTIEALLIFIAAGWIIWEAAKKLIERQPLETVGWGVAVMAFSAVANTIVARMLFKVGKETDSIALMADGWHLRTDVYTSIGVMTGLAVIWVMKLIFPTIDIEWIDPIAAIGVACLIIKAAWDLTRDSSGGLMDQALPADEQAEIRQIILSNVPKIRGCNQLRSRKSGHYRFVEIHVQLDEKLPLDTVHDITKGLVGQIQERFAHATVVIHADPCNGQCDGKCQACCLMEEVQRLKFQESTNLI